MRKSVIVSLAGLVFGLAMLSEALLSQEPTKFSLRKSSRDRHNRVAVVDVDHRALPGRRRAMRTAARSADSRRAWRLAPRCRNVRRA